MNVLLAEAKLIYDEVLTAFRVGRIFGTSAEMRINMQARYDLEAARGRLESRIEAGGRAAQGGLSGAARRLAGENCA